MISGEQRAPRFIFDLTDEQQRRCNKAFVTYGQRRAVMSVILEDLLDLIEKHGQVITGLIINRSVQPREILPSLYEAETKAKKL